MTTTPTTEYRLSDGTWAGCEIWAWTGTEGEMIGRVNHVTDDESVAQVGAHSRTFNVAVHPEQVTAWAAKVHAMPGGAR